MGSRLSLYRSLLGNEIIDSLHHTAESLKGAKLVHVNSTREGGGVAEILQQMVPLTQELGLHVEWATLDGNDSFFQCTKMFHNLLQGQKSREPSPTLLQTYEQVNADNAARMRPLLTNADIVFIHDPQPVALLAHLPQRQGSWIWRCHIDLSAPSNATWNYLKQYVQLYNATIFSLKDFVQALPHPVYIIPPSIDPFSPKNISLSPQEINEISIQHGIDPERPMILQVSRFDRFKDPLGVIQSYYFAKKTHPGLQLVLAGSGASDDPEGLEVLQEVEQAATGDPDIHILLLPPNAHSTINALQRRADIVLQKSLKEGFGLTVSEALWKSKPVIGGNCGGIRLQVLDGTTGFLVNTAEEAALRIQQLLEKPELTQQLGDNGKQLVREKFLITRHLQDYLNVMKKTVS